jgi:hypothetical protein
MIAFSFSYHSDSAADAIRGAQLRPFRKYYLAVRFSHSKTIEDLAYCQALAAKGLAHRVKFAGSSAIAVSIPACHRANFALEGVPTDNAGTIGA